MQGLATYTGIDSFLHKLNTDSASSFELTSLNNNSLSTGIYWLDAALSRFSCFEVVLYPTVSCFPVALVGAFGVSYAAMHLLAAVPTDLFFSRLLKTQLSADVDSSVLSDRYLFSQTGLNFDAIQVSMGGFRQIVESLDILLLGFELLCAVLLFAQLATMKGRLQKQLVGYDDIVTFCQVRGISVTEIFGLLTFALGFVFFDMFVSLAEDDSLEALSYIFASVIVCAVVLLFLAADVQFYFLISSISGGELTLRILYTDIVNNGLCLLRIFFC